MGKLSDDSNNSNMMTGLVYTFVFALKLNDRNDLQYKYLHIDKLHIDEITTKRFTISTVFRQFHRLKILFCRQIHCF